MTAALARFVVACDLGTRRAGLAIYDRTVGPVGEVTVGVSIVLPAMSIDGMVATYRDLLSGLRIPDADLVLEWPRKYKTRSGAWADLDDMRAVGRGVEALGPWASKRRVSPGAWKGHVPKYIHHVRIGAALSADERARVQWDTLGPDGRDAIGLAVWAATRPAGTP